MSKKQVKGKRKARKRHIDPFVIEIERRVQQLGDGFDARKRMRELNDEMQPLLATWEENPEDEKKLDALEHEAQVVGVALRCEGKVMDRKMVKEILNDIIGTGTSSWLEEELASA